MLPRGSALSSRLRFGIRRLEPTIHWVPTQEHGNQLNQETEKIIKAQIKVCDAARSLARQASIATECTYSSINSQRQNARAKEL